MSEQNIPSASEVCIHFRIHPSSKTRPCSASEYKKEIYRLVKAIPKGQVVTYGQIAKKFQISLSTRNSLKASNFKFQISAQMVGFMLHQNKDLNVPCHRVVDRNGRLAPNYGFGGAREQRKRLVLEGVKFKDGVHVDLGSCLWQDSFKISN